MNTDPKKQNDERIAFIKQASIAIFAATQTKGNLARETHAMMAVSDAVMLWEDLHHRGHT